MSTTIRNVSRIFANNRTDRRVDFSRKEVRGVVMGIFWTLMVTVSLVYGAVSGRLSAVTAAALEGAAAAVELVLVMAGALCLWSGVLELMRRSGMAAGLSRLLRPVLRRLLPQAGRDEETLDALSANVSANLLGLGNAATPAGIQAARRMAVGCSGTASDELCRLVVLNTASVQLLPSTVAALRGGLGNEVDIIEVGTMLILMEGVRAARIMRACFPDKIMVADAALSVAHFGPKVLAAGTQFVTMFSPARNEVKAAILAQAKAGGQDVQIELYGDYGESWTFDDLREWKDIGIRQIIYGRPSSASGPWTAQDVDFVRQLCDMGFEVTATGGITYEDLDILAGLPLYAVICGRSIRNAENPAAEARRIKARMQELWA